MAVPFERLGIPDKLRKNLADDAPKKIKIAVASGLLPLPPEVQLSALYVLAAGADSDIAKRAQETLIGMPWTVVLTGVNDQTHPKVLEFLASFREADPELDQQLITMRTINDRTAVLIAARADEKRSTLLSNNQERLLLTPEVFTALYGNPACSEVQIERMSGFLRLQDCLPEVPAKRPFLADDPQPEPEAPKAEEGESSAEMDLEAEIMAAIMGEQSPALLGAQQDALDMFNLDAVTEDKGDEGLDAFVFDFSDASDAFSFDLTRDGESGQEEEKEYKNIELKIKDMTAGEKVKLAYLGNKEARRILIRDRNTIVCTAVVKSGRMSDGEAAEYAADRNLADEVIRLIANTRNYTRKYSIKVALVNNPKCPPAVAKLMVGVLSKRDLKSLVGNHNVSGDIAFLARRVFKTKYTR